MSLKSLDHTWLGLEKKYEELSVGKELAEEVHKECSVEYAEFDVSIEWGSFLLVVAGFLAVLSVMDSCESLGDSAS